MDPAWNTHRTQLHAAIVKATRQLLDLVRANPDMTEADLLFYYQALIEQYGQAATESAFQALENSRRAVGLWNDLPDPVLADLPPVAQVEGTMAWAVNKAARTNEGPRVNLHTVAALLTGVPQAAASPAAAASCIVGVLCIEADAEEDERLDPLFR